MTRPGILSLCCLGILLRWSTSLYPYSGQGKPPLHGDYEAQRHWQEVTINLPTDQWYINGTNNDLMYWGLDYPPLSSYHSYICGLVARQINPKFVELHKSRGYESDSHKLFMRYTVLIADLLVFIPAVLLIIRGMGAQESFLTLSALMLYPGLILIDHGHFQYNNMSLGLFLFAVSFLIRGSYLTASIFFTMALNYKQMELYHALPIFSYLLGKCYRQKTLQQSFIKLVGLGSTVIITFGICWFPFLTSLDGIKSVLLRVFPLYRGLFEDKVANFWCVISVIIKVRDIFEQQMLATICLLATSLASAPSCIHLAIQPTIRNLKYTLVNVSMAFFLFSYHVHEKSILLVAIPVCLLAAPEPQAVAWFLLSSSLSMFHLLVKDGLTLPCIVITLFFWLTYRLWSKQAPHYRPQGKINLLFNISISGFYLLAFLHLYLEPPRRYPDLYPLAIASYSFVHFSLAWLWFSYRQFSVLFEKSRKRR